MYEYPFGNGQQLNLDWFLAEWKNLLAAWEAEKNGIAGALDAEIAKAEAALADVFTARDAAAQSAANALESKNAAAQSASDASEYLATVSADANAARDAAQNAADSASAAAQSQTAAGNSASAAAQSAADADASKSAAAQSAEDAENAANSVEASTQQISTNTTDIANLKESLSYNPTTGIVLAWENKAIRASDGTVTAANQNRLKNVDPLPKNYIAFSCSTPYSFAVFGYNGNTYVGWWTGTEWSTADIIWETGNVNFEEITNWEIYDI